MTQHTSAKRNDDNTIEVAVLGIPARHTHKRYEAAELAAAGVISRQEVLDMVQGRRNFDLYYVGSAFETYTFRLVELT